MRAHHRFPPSAIARPPRFLPSAPHRPLRFYRLAFLRLARVAPSTPTLLSSTNPPPTVAHTVPAVRHFLAAPAPSPAPSLPPPPAVRTRTTATTGGITGTTGGGGAHVRGMSGGSGGSIYVTSTREPSGLASVPLELLATQPTAAQAAYGAAILAFLGGPHWGLAMARYAATTSEASLGNFSVSAARYTWSVVPSLAAWVALLLPDGPKFALLLSFFLLVLGADTVFARTALVPSWYLPLRVLLSSIALLSLAATGFTVVTGTAISQQSSPQSTANSQPTPPAAHSTAVPSPVDQQPGHSAHPRPSSTHPSTFESSSSAKQ
ncbi:unnamed protein product [Closterium sp. Yama58-4]|nr:unnamed protein product [Closterium sp. Yama58-4]